MNSCQKKITITIDGPAGSGKGTTAKGVAERLGYSYLDTGALYRMVTLYCIDHNIFGREREKVIDALKKITMEFTPEGKAILNGEDVSEKIRTEEVNKRVSPEFTYIPEVRDFITKQSQKIVASGGYVLDGRDAGAVIAPHAELKIYLECDPWERARRRALEFHKVRKEDVEKILNEIILPRDEADKLNIDRSREQGICVDTTNLDIRKQINEVYQLALEKIKS